MTFFGTPIGNGFFDIVRGQQDGFSSLHKFGRNPNIGTSFEPITFSANYQTPTTAQALEILSTSANDAAAGSGARKVDIQGLDSNWDMQEETVTLNGITPVALANNYIRLFRAFVSESGTYATQLVGSHEGNITIRGSGGGSTWAEIDDVSTFPRGQTQIGAYTVPNGMIAYVQTLNIYVESAKSANIAFFQRQNADDVSSPFDAMRLLLEFDGVEGAQNISFTAPQGPFPSKTDIGFLGRFNSGTGSIAVDFEIILEEE